MVIRIKTTIITKFHGPTNVKGARYSAADQNGHRITLAMDHELSDCQNHDRAALALCLKMGWTDDVRMVRGHLKGSSNVYVFDEPRGRVAVSGEKI